MKKYLLIVLCLVQIYLLFGCVRQEPEDGSTVHSGSPSQSAPVSSSSSVESSSQEAPAPEDLLPEAWENTLSEPPEKFQELFPIPVIRRDISSPVDRITVDGASQMPTITNETPLVDMMSEINIYTAMAEIRNTYYHKNMGLSMRPEYYMEHGGIPMNFLRQTEEGKYYTVCKVANGGYAYFFFELQYPTTDMTSIVLTSCVYAEKTLSYADFADIKAGDPLEKVIAVDNVAKLPMIYAEWNRSIRGRLDCTYSYVSLHLLQDGLLTIFINCDENGNFTVTDLVFSDEFILYSLGGYPKSLKILPQDYPPET